MPSIPISSPAVVGEADPGKIKSIEPEITPVTGAFYFKSSPDPSLNKAALDKFRQDHPNLNITFGPTVNGQTLLLTSPVK